MRLAVPRSNTVQQSHDRGVSLYQLCMVGGEHARACTQHGTVKIHRMGLYPFSKKLRFEIVNMHRVCVHVHHFVGIRLSCVIEYEKNATGEDMSAYLHQVSVPHEFVFVCLA